MQIQDRMTPFLRDTSIEQLESIGNRKSDYARVEFFRAYNHLLKGRAVGLLFSKSFVVIAS
jgi:hypothetical protein